MNKLEAGRGVLEPAQAGIGQPFGRDRHKAEFAAHHVPLGAGLHGPRMEEHGEVGEGPAVGDQVDEGDAAAAALEVVGIEAQSCRFLCICRRSRGSRSTR